VYDEIVINTKHHQTVPMTLPENDLNRKNELYTWWQFIISKILYAGDNVDWLSVS
jgi:hypothetical protein